MALLKDPWAVLEPQLKANSVAKLVPLAGDRCWPALWESLEDWQPDLQWFLHLKIGGAVGCGVIIKKNV